MTPLTSTTALMGDGESARPSDVTREVLQRRWRSQNPRRWVDFPHTCQRSTCNLEPLTQWPEIWVCTKTGQIHDCREGQCDPRRWVYDVHLGQRRCPISNRIWSDNERVGWADGAEQQERSDQIKEAREASKTSFVIRHATERKNYVESPQKSLGRLLHRMCATTKNRTERAEVFVMRLLWALTASQRGANAWRAINAEARASEYEFLRAISRRVLVLWCLFQRIQDRSERKRTRWDDPLSADAFFPFVIASFYLLGEGMTLSNASPGMSLPKHRKLEKSLPAYGSLGGDPWGVALWAVTKERRAIVTSLRHGREMGMGLNALRLGGSRQLDPALMPKIGSRRAGEWRGVLPT